MNVVCGFGREELRSGRWIIYAEEMGETGGRSPAQGGFPFGLMLFLQRIVTVDLTEASAAG